MNRQCGARFCVLFFLSVFVAACGVKTGKFELPPGNSIDRDAYPWRVGVITEKTFTPYKITFRYWSTAPFMWSLDGLPDAFAAALRRHFVSAETLPVGRDISPERHDLVAKMSVDQLHFDGANTTYSADKVDLTMTFSLQQPNGTEVFRTTISTTATGYSLSGDGSNRVYFRPRPQDVFPKAFRDVFEQLSERLKVAEIRVVPEADNRALSDETTARCSSSRRRPFVRSSDS